MPRSLVGDLALTGVVAMTVEAVFPFLDALASTTARGPWPWLGAVLAFGALRLAVGLTHAGFSRFADALRQAGSPKPSSRDRS